MDEYNFKFRVVKNIGKESLMYFGEPGTIHNVENGSFFIQFQLGIITEYCTKQ